MKKIFLAIALTLVTLQIGAQLNVQMHYDFGHTIYGGELSNRPNWTATIENFKADKWGSTYFFVDGNFADNTMASVYAEFSRELRFWKAPLAVHLEYNGGVAGTGNYNDAYLAGIAWNWASADFKNILYTSTLPLSGSPNYRHKTQLATDNRMGNHFRKRIVHL